jgi:hypothetical protein
MEKMV